MIIFIIYYKFYYLYIIIVLIVWIGFILSDFHFNYSLSFSNCVMCFCYFII